MAASPALLGGGSAELQGKILSCKTIAAFWPGPLTAGVPFRPGHFTLPPYYHLAMVESGGQEIPPRGTLGRSGMYILTAIQKLVMSILLSRYRPELHYMRGRGPKWLERNASAHAGRHD